MNGKKIIFIFVIVILLGLGIFAWLRKDKAEDQDMYRYEYRLDYDDERYTNQVSVIIYRKNISTGLGEPYSAIVDTTLYRYINQHY